jgi:hypothetical protein
MQPVIRGRARRDPRECAKRLVHSRCSRRRECRGGWFFGSSAVLRHPALRLAISDAGARASTSAVPRQSSITT